MSIRVAINGFGRIGRLVFRVLAERNDFDVVAINDLTDAKTLAILLKYDSTQGRFNGTVEADGDALIVNGKKIPVLAVRAPKELPWKDMNVDIAAECTGFFTARSSDRGGYGDHITAGAKKVLLSAPAKDEVDATIVMGVNEDVLQKDHLTFSNASCTTNCTAPVVKVIHDAFGIENGLITTIHAYTGDQKILDAVHSDLRRARAGATNIIPTKTGMSKAIGQVIPDLLGKVDGMAIRVPVPVGSLIDTALVVKRDVTNEEVNDALTKAADGPMKGVLQVETDPIVSSDIVGNSHSSIVDAQSTKVSNSRLVKVVSWYDNEWGFSNRMADLVKKAHELGY